MRRRSRGIAAGRRGERGLDPWFLLLALARHDEVGVARCVNCGALRVRDLLARRKLTCGNCDGAIDSAARAAPC